MSVGTSWGCIRLVEFCPNQFPGIRKGLCPFLSLWSLSSLCDTRALSEDWCFQTSARPSPPLRTVTQNRALSLGTCSQQQADLVAAPATTSRGQSLEGRQAFSNLTPLDALAGLRLTRLFPSQEPVTLLKARPWREISVNGSLEKKKRSLWREKKPCYGMVAEN